MSFAVNHGGGATILGPRTSDGIEHSSMAVTGVIESLTAARDAREDLITDGFTASEIRISAGCDAPNALRRGGFLFAVDASTRRRQEAAVEILMRLGAHTVRAGERRY